jgi:hypothetical protein
METPTQILDQLNILVSRVKLHSVDCSDLDVHVSPPQIYGGPYLIDISKGRFSRRVIVDVKTAQNIQSGFADESLVRELRSAMLGVAKLSRDRK